MQPTLMSLRVLVPFGVFASHEGVLRIVAETPEGAFGLLPRRRDCVATLSPGILFFESEGDGDTYLAVDEGLLVKTGPKVVVSVRRAIGGADLKKLRQQVEEEFLALSEEEQSVRVVMARLETGFLRRFASFQNE